jgi:hypothetical protein
MLLPQVDLLHVNIQILQTFCFHVMRPDQAHNSSLKLNDTQFTYFDKETEWSGSVRIKVLRLMTLNKVEPIKLMQQ